MDLPNFGLPTPAPAMWGQISSPGHAELEAVRLANAKLVPVPQDRRPREDLAVHLRWDSYLGAPISKKLWEAFRGCIDADCCKYVNVSFSS